MPAKRPRRCRESCRSWDGSARKPLWLRGENVRGVWIARHVVRQKLERHKAIPPGVLSLVHHTHSATAEFFHDAVMRNGLSHEGIRAGHERAHLILRERASQTNGLDCPVLVNALSGQLHSPS